MWRAIYSWRTLIFTYRKITFMPWYTSVVNGTSSLPERSPKSQDFLEARPRTRKVYSPQYPIPSSIFFEGSSRKINPVNFRASWLERNDTTSCLSSEVLLRHSWHEHIHLTQTPFLYCFCLSSCLWLTITILLQMTKWELYQNPLNLRLTGQLRSTKQQTSKHFGHTDFLVQILMNEYALESPTIPSVLVS